MIEPFLHQLEPFGLDPINTAAALPLVTEKTCRLQNLQVARGCRPGLLEDCGNPAGRHGTAIEVDRQQDAPPRRMGQRAEDQFVRIDAFLECLAAHSIY